MKDHDENQGKQCAKLPIPTKSVKKTLEQAAPAGKVRKPDASPSENEAMKATGGAREIQKTSRAETLDDPMPAVCEAVGIRGERPAARILSQMAEMQIWGQGSADDVENTLSGLEMMVELKPANVLEAMLNVHMVGVHEAALMFLKRATIEDQTTEGIDVNVNRATRLLHLFTEQLHAMARLKGKTGLQKVTVEHVNVYPGGQAIVGAVTACKEESGEGEGSR